jgi:hypothetical protein
MAGDRRLALGYFAGLKTSILSDPASILAPAGRLHQMPSESPQNCQLTNLIGNFRFGENSLSNYFTFTSKGLFFTWFFQSFVIDNLPGIIPY